jgi:hypothetical protein
MKEMDTNGFPCVYLFDPTSTPAGRTIVERYENIATYDRSVIPIGVFAGEINIEKVWTAISQLPPEMADYNRKLHWQIPKWVKRIPVEQYGTWTCVEWLPRVEGEDDELTDADLKTKNAALADIMKTVAHVRFLDDFPIS